MSYEPTTWQTGDILTAEKLNKMEQGIVDAAGSGGGAFIVTYTYDEGTDTTSLGQTYNEICAAVNAGNVVLMPAISTQYAYIYWLDTMICENVDGAIDYYVSFNKVGGGSEWTFTSDSPDGVLSYTYSDDSGK